MITLELTDAEAKALKSLLSCETAETAELMQNASSDDREELAEYYNVVQGISAKLN